MGNKDKSIKINIDKEDNYYFIFLKILKPFFKLLDKLREEDKNTFYHVKKIHFSDKDNKKNMNIRLKTGRVIIICDIVNLGIERKKMEQEFNKKLEKKIGSTIEEVEWDY